LAKHGVSPCSATLHKCQRKQIQKDINRFHLRELEETRMPSYYMDEDYQARPEIQYPLPELSNLCGSESSTLYTDVYVQCYARNEWTNMTKQDKNLACLLDQ